MLINIIERLQSIFSFWAIAAFLICGVWSYVMVSPALGKRGFARESLVAKRGGLGYIFGIIVIFILIKILGFVANI
ncbi:hypothetical protein RDV78_07280 [Bacillota bacterium LX-D]|nr:hypothetical protein [Bacillota bacterium LX-D]